MSYTDEEVDLIVKERELREAVIADKQSEEGRAAKAALREFRKEWREIRAEMGGLAPGTALPGSIDVEPEVGYE